MNQASFLPALIIASTIFLSIACQPNIKNVSSRDLSAFDRDEDSKILRKGRPQSHVKKAPEIFIKKPNVKIKPVMPDNTTGSLFKPDDARNYLFTTYSSPVVGSYLRIKVVNHNLVPGKKSADSEPGATSPSVASGNESPPKEPDLLAEEELMKALPHLDPGSFDAEAIIDELNMKVIHQHENGDLSLSWERMSTGPEDARILRLQARLPYRNLSPSETLTTKDLTDIELLESYKGDVLEKNATGWQDEYTLRISGFDEAKSKMAAQLESKRLDLVKLRDQVRTRLETMGSERRQWAKERDGWLKKRAEDKIRMEQVGKEKEEQKALIEEKDSKIKEQEDLIKDQTTQIEELSRPEEKPSDEE